MTSTAAITKSPYRCTAPTCDRLGVRMVNGELRCDLAHGAPSRQHMTFCLRCGVPNPNICDAPNCPHDTTHPADYLCPRC